MPLCNVYMHACVLIGCNFVCRGWHDRRVKQQESRQRREGRNLKFQRNQKMPRSKKNVYSFHFTHVHLVFPWISISEVSKKNIEQKSTAAFHWRKVTIIYIDRDWRNLTFYPVKRSLRMPYTSTLVYQNNNKKKRIKGKKEKEVRFPIAVVKMSCMQEIHTAFDLPCISNLTWPNQMIITIQHISISLAKYKKIWPMIHEL